tara:strand:- start:136130 stop:137218 length:1089 start_codon:yes stop_codon:yes gene_type:complete
MNIEWYYIAWPVTILVTFYLTKLKFQVTKKEPVVATTNEAVRDKLKSAVEAEYCPQESTLANLIGKDIACLSYMSTILESGNVTESTLHSFANAIDEMHVSDSTVGIDQINSFREALDKHIPSDFCEKIVYDIKYKLDMLEFKAINSTKVTVNGEAMGSIEEVANAIHNQNKICDDGDLKDIYERIVKYDKDLGHTPVGFDMLKKIVGKVCKLIPLDEFAFDIDVRKFTGNLKYILDYETKRLSEQQKRFLYGEIIYIDFNLILIIAKLGKLSKEDYLTDYEYEIFKDQVITENGSGAIYLKAIQNEVFILWPKSKLIQLVYRNYCEDGNSIDLIDFADFVVWTKHKRGAFTPLSLFFCFNL